MVVDHIRNAALYTSLNPGFARAFDFLRGCMEKEPAPGHYEIDGDQVYANVMAYETEPADHLGWEAHRRYIDIQFIVSGREQIGYTGVESLKDASAYDETRDILLAPRAENVTPVRLESGYFAILWPQDAHQPKGCVDIPGGAVKAVVKVKV